jgi:hypothetical protein
MKLNELNYNMATKSKRVLKETYNTDFDASRLSYSAAKGMFAKACSLLKEAQQSPDFYKKQGTPARMKLIFIKESLAAHLAEFSQRIITENEKVEEAQVTLAAQDMVDEIQKMIEKVSDMLVKELPALSDGVESEVGVNEGEQFTAQATEALTALSAALGQAKTGLQGARNIITGQGEPAGEFGAAPEEEMPSMGGEETPDMGSEEEMPEMPGLPEVPEMPEEPASNVGRARR